MKQLILITLLWIVIWFILWISIIDLYLKKTWFEEKQSFIYNEFKKLELKCNDDEK